MTEKQEEFLKRLNEVFLDFDVDAVYIHAGNIVFLSNRQEFRIERYEWEDGTPTFIGVKTDYVPGAATYERSK